MEKKISNVEDDFESLFEEEAIVTMKEPKHLSFNDLFEAIAEENEDTAEHSLCDSRVDNVEEDFEALLSDESETEERNNEQEEPSGVGKGFSQIFSSEKSEQVLDSSDNDLKHTHDEHRDSTCGLVQPSDKEAVPTNEQFEVRINFHLIFKYFVKKLLFLS